MANKNDGFDWKAAETDVEEFGGNIDQLNRRNERERDLYLRELDLNPDDYKKKSRSNSSSSGSGGCYVATAVYGSYDCPQVWTLRRYRDDTLSSTWYGREFIRAYYAVSPHLVIWFGKESWFHALCKPALDRKVRKLNVQGVEDTPYEDKAFH